MDILAAIDSFKGSASSFELNQAVLNGWEDRKGRKINVPIADGGENTRRSNLLRARGNWRTIDGWISISSAKNQLFIDELARKRSSLLNLHKY